MDNGTPIDIVLHLEYAPFDEATEPYGWDVQGIEYEIRDAAARLFYQPSRLTLVDLEVIEPPRRISVAY